MQRTAVLCRPHAQPADADLPLAAAQEPFAGPPIQSRRLVIEPPGLAQGPGPVRSPVAALESGCGEVTSPRFPVRSRAGPAGIRDSRRSPPSRRTPARNESRVPGSI